MRVLDKGIETIGGSMTQDQHAVLQKFLEEIEKKKSWGKNQLVKLIADIACQTIDARRSHP